MPAWQGLAFVESFFSSTTGWTFGGEALTHAVGLVFCHHNAPIHAVKGVAERLAISAKDTTNRKGNSINYVVLESFDHTGTDWNDYLKRVYNGQLFAACRCLSAADFASTLAALRTLKHGLPRSRVAPYIQSLIAGNADPDKAEKRRDHDLDEATKSAASALCAPHTNCPLAGWSHCADLWDYLDEGAAQ